MPASGKYPQGHKLPLRDRVLVVIGANGSGKTRFGVWLESQSVNLHHRVSAHRALTFPEKVHPTDLEDAEQRLLNGEHRNWSKDSGALVAALRASIPEIPERAKRLPSEVCPVSPIAL